MIIRDSHRFQGYRVDEKTHYESFYVFLVDALRYPGFVSNNWKFLFGLGFIICDTLLELNSANHFFFFCKHFKSICYNALKKIYS